VLRPASVDPRTGYPRYLAQQLEDLASILALKSLGVSLGRVRDVMGRRGSPADKKAILHELKGTVERSIKTARQSLIWIDVALGELDDGRGPIPVVIKRRPPVPIASLRIELNSYQEVSRFEQELWHALPPECLGRLRGVLWHRCADSGSLEAEPFVGLKQRAPGRVSCRLGQLPGATLACAYSRFDDHSAEQADDAIRRWMKLRGYRLAGPKRELYLCEKICARDPISRSPKPTQI
jgi:effector-binding domain-containing protein